MRAGEAAPGDGWLECVHSPPLQGPGPVMMMVYTARSLDGWGSSRNTLDLHSESHVTPVCL